jgi:GDP-L-fucose synthase
MKEDYLLSGPLEPTNEPYAIAKIAGIKLCQSYNRQYGTNFIAVMPTNLFGPNDNYDLMDSHVLPALIRKFHLAKLLAEGKLREIIEDLKKYGNAPENLSSTLTSALIINHLSQFGIKVSSSTLASASTCGNSLASNLKPQSSNSVVVEVWGTGSPRREFMYSDDMADACVFLMSNYDGNKIVNIGTGEDVTIRELGNLIAEVVGYKGGIRWDTTKPDGMPQKLLDVSMLEGLGWRYKTSLKEGVHQTYQDFLKKHTRR